MRPPPSVFEQCRQILPSMACGKRAVRSVKGIERKREKEGARICHSFVRMRGEGSEERIGG